MPFPLEMRLFHPVIFHRSIKKSLNINYRGNEKPCRENSIVSHKTSTNLIGMKVQKVAD